MDLNNMLKEGSDQLGVDLDQKQIAQFMKYKEVLLEWNQKMNLTAIEDDKEIIIKHFLDSISCAKSEVIGNSGKVIDVGTGAGFPGIPLKIIFPNIELTLLDSLNKRIGFLKEVGNQLGINDIEYVHGRAEDVGQNKNYREKFDFAVARAVAPLNILLEYCLPFVKVGGYFICQKGSKLIEEMEESRVALKVLGGEVLKQIEVPLPFSDISHNIVIIRKIKQTSTKYPRKAGKPSKEPIK
ncbi:16S rRNA (guanine(527)-N(7))-methyltransferase RsmG [Serpentinicella alkaliphila]|uniref:Ribosomal RNA small subunit methyltransferase G n=1 Tax=Serpentinicella alkaliphila TaxID=1734049 RepID=A0A4R2TX57_9FIRM|nr:16S rRNA (guanine(527)-N(7))-methyltransferase RsmG [Serpentinicella alkaliphila]QUH25150.1 16S rRNA (guanine(527)-N(7))-methyltransferase RsmG [Serpentinicella alkaliphila]TCQ02239.1 16S rRNA m(7)G-527 methyltransferase [Serpentinicella alkaliphila]